MKNSKQINWNRLLKREFLWLATHFCRHNHRYIEHMNCYWTEAPDPSPLKEKIGFLDIESTNLKSSFGYVISWAIKEQDGELFSACVRPDEIRKESRSSLEDIILIDKRILEKFYKTAMKFDKLCVYWGKNRRHDVPYLRQRCLRANVPFPLYGDIFCLDMYDWTKNFLSMHSYRLAAVCEAFNIPAKSHKLTGEVWIKAATGNQAALDFIMEHNNEDVLCLEPLYEMLEPFARRQRTSI